MKCNRSKAFVILAVVAFLLAGCGDATVTTAPATTPGSATTAGTTSASTTAATSAATTAATTATSAATTAATTQPATTTAAPTQPAGTTAGATTTAGNTGNGDWTTYHRDNTRTGYVASSPDPKQLAQKWEMNLDGAVYAEPLVIGSHLLVATEGDTIYSLDAQSGKIEWQTNVGKPAPGSELPCGNIKPLGITGTPVYDPATGLIFALAEVSGPSHILFGLDAKTGQIKLKRPADLPGMEPAPHQQRGALALANGYVYIPYGGLFGDCGNYHGIVIASRTDGQRDFLSFQVPTPREGGIWAPPGPAIDSSGNLYVSVGNGETTGGDWDHSDSVLRLSPQLKLEDGFAPKNWAQENARDVDLGSMSPVLLPNGFIFMAGKSNTVYSLKTSALGGVGGEVQSASLCAAYGGAASMDNRVIVPCRDGIRSVRVEADGKVTPEWQAKMSGSPVIGGHTVYSVDQSGTLYALDLDSGSTRASVKIPATSRFATPTISNGLVFVGTLTGVVAISLGQ